MLGSAATTEYDTASAGKCSVARPGKHRAAGRIGVADITTKKPIGCVDLIIEAEYVFPSRIRGREGGQVIVIVGAIAISGGNVGQGIKGEYLRDLIKHGLLGRIQQGTIDLVRARDDSWSGDLNG